MKRILQAYPIHTFITGIYFIYFIFVNNFHKVTMSMTVRSVLVSLLLAAFVFGSVYLFLRNARKAGVFATLLLTGFYTYGYLVLFLSDNNWPFSNLHRVLIGSFILVYLILLFFIVRTKGSFRTGNYAFNILLIALLLVNTYSLVQAAGIHPVKEKNPFLGTADSLALRPGSDVPDVYYIVLDGYASEHTLRKYYNEEQPLLFKTLREKGFYVADSSKANYFDTSPSLASTLNMSYLPGGKERPVMIRQNLVTHMFKRLGYRVVNMESGFVVTQQMEFADKTIPVAGPNEFELYILRYTFLMVVDMLRLSNYSRLKSQVARLYDVTAEKGPKFGFIHIVSPHPPYIVDEHGNKTTKNAVSDSWEPRAHYLGQTKFISKRILSLISDILSVPGRKPIIILQSDHGPWVKDSPANVYEARTGILNAFYVPPELKRKLYPSISPVNTFRILFSELSNVTFPLLPDNPVAFDSIARSSAFKLYSK